MALALSGCDETTSPSRPASHDGAGEVAATTPAEAAPRKGAPTPLREVALLLR
jgi:hypothetical protein